MKVKITMINPKKWLVTMFAATLVCPLFAASPAPLKWDHRLPDALETAAKTQKSVLLLFTNLDGCGACRKLDEQVLTQSDVIQKITAGFIPVRINLTLAAEANPNTAKIIQKYLVPDAGTDRPALPSTVVLMPDGTVAGRISGFLPAKFWLKELEFLRNPPALFQAVRTGSEADVRKLLSNGVNVNLTAPSGVTALIDAVRRGSSAGFIKTLLNFHPDVNARDNQNATALFYAVKADRTDLARLLLNEKANPMIAVGDTTPFHEAVRRGDLEMIRAFADAGADLNMPSPSGRPAVLVAALAENIPALEFLVSRGANIFCTDAEGNNGLHYGAMLCNRGVYQFFHLRGLNILAKNKKGKIPNQLVSPNDDAFIFKLSTPPQK